MTLICKGILTNKQRRYLKFKRAFDVFFALFLLIILWPIMLISAVWVKLESPGSIIFSQKRPGYHQKIFKIYKFRSMRIDTTSDKGFPLSDKERLTISGRVLRKTSIDELPQLINILKGEMSFIGPRPFLINDLGNYSEEQLVRFEVLPGISSWTAIHGRNMLTIQDKYNLEIYYVNNIGFKIDLQIFLKTIVLVLMQKNIEDYINKEIPASQIISDEVDHEKYFCSGSGGAPR